MPNPEIPYMDDATPPSVFVNGKLLEHDTDFKTPRTPKPATYRIDGDVFYEERIVDANQLSEFEVYAEPVTENMDCDMYCATPTDSGSECADDPSEEPLEITLQSVPNGFIINNNCFLPWQHWNTIVPTSMTAALVECLVCGQFCEEKDSGIHVESQRHVAQLENTQPLAKFDLCVVRKIGNNYHCAVCNESFKIPDEIEHFSGKTHEGNLLFSINKASDITNSCTNHSNSDAKTTKTDTYHYRGFEDDIKDNRHFINFQNHLEYEDEEILTSEFSYANIAKKPKAVTQKYLDVDLGNKKVKVKFDSWHMVISPKMNRFWCMVCKVFDHIRNKLDHCKEVEHLKNVAGCPVVEAYEEYFIRQVDDKLYHCGHCNNLQMIHEMVDHIEVNHPRKTKIVLDSTSNANSPMKTSKNRKNSVCDDKSDKSSVCSESVTNSGESANQNSDVSTQSSNMFKGKPVYYKNVSIDTGESVSNGRPITKNSGDEPAKLDTTVTNGASGKTPGIYDNITISPFGIKMTLPVMAYNIICKRPTDFYCGLCNVLCDEKEIENHINDSKHVDLLQRTPFIKPFGCNLIRAIRDALHCAICNMPIDVEKIDLHSKDPQHFASLSLAFMTPQKSAQNSPIKLPKMANLTGIPVTYSNMPPNITPNLTNSYPIYPNMTPNLTNLYPIYPNVTPNLTSFRPLGNFTTNNATSPNFTNYYPNISPYVTNIPPNLPNIYPNIPNMIPSFPQTTNISPNVSPNYNMTPTSPYHTPKSMSPHPGPNHSNGIDQNDTINQVFGSPNHRNHETNKENTNIEANKILFEAKKLEESTKKLEESTKDMSLKKVDLPSKKVDLPSKKVDLENESPDEDLDDTIESLSLDDATFDFEEQVYLKLKNSFIKISNTSYNTLVGVGDSSRYCFVCSSKLQAKQLQRHVDCRLHLENMEKYRFIDKYEDHLLRQSFLMYHCAICNVIISRKDLKTHLEWSTHVLLNENTAKNLKKTRKNEIKSGIKQIIVSTQKENIYLNEKEPAIKIILNATLDSDEQSLEVPEEFSNKNKIIIFNDNVLKIACEAWHGITKVKNGYKCVLCQKDLKARDVEEHCNIQWHKYSLDKPFEKQYAPALIRKINETTLNCLFCNTEVSNRSSIITEHVNGKKHIKNYEAILKESSLANTYTDCQDDVLML